MMDHEIGMKLQKDNNLFHTLYRSSTSEEISVWEYKFLVMGAADAQFQSCSSLHKLADEVEDASPEAAEVLRSMYMEDGNCLGESSDETFKLLEDTIRVLEKYNFTVH